MNGNFSAGGFMIKSKQAYVSHRNAWWTSNSSAIFIRSEILKDTGIFDENVGLGNVTLYLGRRD
jgi:hypothetical protein